MGSFAPDLCVMAYVTLFVPQPVIDAPKLGTIQYHPSLLPLHRGPSSINWPIIQGETKTGLTVFWPDEGLDEGPVLLQKEVEIAPDDTLGSLYFNQLFPMGVDAMLEAVDLVRDGTAPRVAQDHSQATYESWCRKADAEIDWSKPAREVYNLIRGANPQPGAWTTVGGNELKIFDCSPAEASGAPGEVEVISEEGFTVACGEAGLLVRRVRPHDGGKISAADYVSGAGLSGGARLGA
jgi:methionyl-tRNA formyltransferase